MSYKPDLVAVLGEHQVGTFRIDEDDEAINVYVDRSYDGLYADLRTKVPATVSLMLEILPMNWNHPQFQGIEAFAPIANAVSHPAHYNAGKIEVIEAIEDWKVSFHRGNAIKYIARAGKKDPTKECEDLEKAVWYLNREIEVLRAKAEAREVVRPNDMVKK